MGCQQNGPEHGQVQNWYLNEKMVLVPVFFRMRGCCIVLRYFRRDVGDKIFLKYPEEDRSSSSHAGIRNIPADVCYDDTKPYQVPSEKQGRCISFHDIISYQIYSEAVARRYSVKNVFLEILQNSQEKTCARASFCRLFFNKVVG